MGALANKSAAGGGGKEGSLPQPSPLPSGGPSKPVSIGALAGGSAASTTPAPAAGAVVSLAGLAGSTPANPTPAPARPPVVSHTALSVIRMKTPMVGVSGPAEGAAEDQKSALPQSETTSATSSQAEVPQQLKTVENAAGWRENPDRPLFTKAPWKY